jgi:nucleoside-diphosphate-sugar epimerase
VLTSSFAAIGYGHTPQTAPFDETSWTELRADLSAYVKSKTLAERAAWDFVAKEGRGLELSVVNPVGIFGPVLGPDYATSVHIIRRLMEGAILWVANWQLWHKSPLSCSLAQIGRHTRGENSGLSLALRWPGNSMG